MKTTEAYEIKSHLENVWSNFIIKYPHLRRYRDGVFFAGGCIRSLVQGEKPKDYDIFFSDSRIRKAFMLMCHESRLGTPTLNSISFKMENADIQFITIRCEKPLDEILSFDFTFNMNYYDLKKEELYVHDLEAIQKKRIVFNYNCRNAFDTFYRIFTFIDRGYESPSQNCKDKMATRLTQLDAIKTKEQFINSTRRCSSSIIKYGRLDFLEEK